MEMISLSVSAAMLMGFAFGAGPCNLACLPYLGPVFLARADGIRYAWRTLVPFSGGRLAGYSLLGAVAGGAGRFINGWFHQYGAVVLGLATVCVGTLLLLRTRNRTGACSKPASSAAAEPLRRTQPSSRGGALVPLGLFGMGAGMALTPCVPLGTVLLAAAATGGIGDGLLLGFSFGAGAVIMPTVVFGLLVAQFGEQIRRRLVSWSRTIEYGAAGLLVALGGTTALGLI